MNGDTNCVEDLFDCSEPKPGLKKRAGLVERRYVYEPARRPAGGP